MQKGIYIFSKNLFKSALILIACIVSLCACKKDYRKLATEFERRLPDTCVVVKEQINDIDHVVYYKDKSNTYLVRHDLEDNTEESIKPPLEEGQAVCGIYLGKDNIAMLVKDAEDWYYFWFYNLKTLKFKNIDGSFYGASADETNKTLTGNMDYYRGAGTMQFVYDFDGKEVSSNDISSEEAEEQESQTDDILNITQPTTFKVIYNGKVLYTYILYTDGTCERKMTVNAGKSEVSSNGEWRLLEKSIHDQNFRVIVAWVSDSMFTWFTSDNICGTFSNHYSDFDELLLDLEKWHDFYTKHDTQDHRFEVSNE